MNPEDYMASPKWMDRLYKIYWDSPSYFDFPCWYNKHMNINQPIKTMEKKFWNVEYGNDETIISTPEGYEAILDGKNVVIRQKQPKKDLQYWWGKYRTDTVGTFMEGNIYAYPWHILVDFYRWLAEQLNEGWKPCWSRNAEGKFHIYYDDNSDSFGYLALSNHNYGMGVVFKNMETTQKAIEILGQPLLKKIFQINA